MRILIELILLGLTSMAFTTEPGLPTQPPFSLTLSTEKPSLKAGEEVWVKIQMTNTSKHNVNCTSTDVGPVNLSYQFDIRDKAGKAAKKLIAHPELIPGHFRLCSLEPGGTVSSDNHISWLYDLSRPGKYLIRVSRVNSDDESAGVIKSNVITINVKE